MTGKQIPCTHVWRRRLHEERLWDEFGHEID